MAAERPAVLTWSWLCGLGGLGVLAWGIAACRPAVRYLELLCWPGDPGVPARDIARIRCRVSIYAFL